MSSPCVVGVDLGGTKLLAGAVGADMRVLNRALRQAAGLSTEALLEACVDAVRSAAEGVGEVEAAGFGVPCTIDARTGIAVQAVHLPINELALADVLSERIGVPVFVDNDANLAMLAEARRGAAVGVSEAVLLTIGTGIGGGLLLNGEIYRGAVGAGAELGHMVVDYDGPLCQGTCPSQGCLEAVASGNALLREAALSVAVRPESRLAALLEDGEPLSGPLITRLAQEGDALSAELIGRIGERLGIGAASLVNIFNPDVVIIGGGVIAAGELLLGPAREAMRARALPPARDHARIVAAAFGSEAGMIGGALLAREGLERLRNATT